MTAERRPYQRAAIEALLEAYDRGVRRSLFVMPTGTGKTSVFIWAIEEWVKRGGRMPALIVAHREELIEQAAQRIWQLLPQFRVGIEKGSSKASRYSDVVVASVQTIGRQVKGEDPRERVRLKECDPGLVIIDEAHHSPAYTYKRVAARYAGDGETFLVGCTATPKRLDRLSLHKSDLGLFEEVSYEYSIRDAIKDGWLCPLRGFQVKTTTDLRGVRSVGGDFVESDLAKRVQDPARTEAAIKRWMEVASGRQTIAFAVDVAHAKQIAEAFREKGIAAESVDGTMRSDDRAAVMSRFKRGQTTVLSNCQIATEGFDAPATACVLMMRPTQSWSLYVQMAGRGTRVLPDKADCVILDVVDNTDRHELVTLPGMLDLPCNMDLEGRTLEEAAKALEETTGAAACLQDFRPGTFSELETTLKEIDLFKRIETPAAVKSVSRFAWLAVPGGFSLGCGADGTVKREARLGCDAMGDFHLRLVESAPNEEGRIEASIRLEKALGSDEKRLFREADALVEWAWPNAAAVARHDVRWRNDPPTDPQRALMRKLGFTDGQMAVMTKGQASGAISMALAKRERKAA